MRPAPLPGRALLVGVILLAALTAPTAGTARADPHPELGLTAHLSASPATGAIPLNVSFTASTTNGTGTLQYSWSFGDGTTQGTAVPSAMHTYTWIAVFQANVTVTDQLGESATASVNVTVTPTPLALTLVALPSSLAAGSTALFEANVTGGYPPYAYDWTGLPLGCVGANVSSLTCTPTYGGGYTVMVTATDRGGTGRTATIGLVVTGNPPPNPKPPTPAPTGAVSPLEAIEIGLVVVAAAAGAIGAVYGIRARRRR